MRRFYNRIRTIIAWLPLLWKDYDWDYSFFITIIQFKLTRMANCIEKSNIIVDASEIAAQMREAVEHLDKFSDTMEHYPHPDNMPEWSFLGPDNTPCPQEWKDYYNLINEKEQEHWNAAWELVREKGQHWWD